MVSSWAVSGFIATRKSISFLRPMYPFLLARIVYQVGSPAMFDGNIFLPRDRNAHLKNAAQQNCIRTLRAGTIDRRDLNAHVVDDALLPMPPAVSRGMTSVVAIPTPSFS